MSAFRELKRCCVSLEDALNRQATTLFSAKSGETQQNIAAKTLLEKSLYSSKLRLLNAKIKAVSPQVEERIKTGADVAKDYQDVLQMCIRDNALVQSVNRNVAVIKLITTPDSQLSSELVDRKEKISQHLRTVQSLQTHLEQLDACLLEKDEERSRLTREWDEELGGIISCTAATELRGETSPSGPLYKKLQNLVMKMEKMRTLIALLFTARTCYDWIADKDNRLSLLSLTREENTVHGFMEPRL